MNKKWILIAVLALVLVAILILADQLNKPEDVDPNAYIPTTTGPTEPTLPWAAADNELAKTTYEAYQAMTSAEQQAFSDKFSSVKSFIGWYWYAKEEYDNNQDVIVIGPNGGIDINDIINAGTKDKDEK